MKLQNSDRSLINRRRFVLAALVAALAIWLGAQHAPITFSRLLTPNANAGEPSHAVTSPSVNSPAANPIVNTIAGNGTLGFGGDGGQALAASMSDPHGIAVAPDGTIYFADSGNFRIRKIDPSGVISTIAGTGESGSNGDSGLAINATLSLLLSIALDPATNNLYLTDVNNNRVRRIDLTAGTIHAFAGSGTSGFLGDGGNALLARMRRPQGVSVAPDGSVVITDTNNCRIRRVSGGIIDTIAGSGVCETLGNGGQASTASFYFPRRVHVGANGDIFIGDGSLTNEDDTVRRITISSGAIEAVAGGGSTTPGTGTATTMDIGNVNDVTVDALGVLYIGSLTRVYRVDLTSGVLSPYAGTGAFGFSGDGGPALDAEFNIIQAVAFRDDALIISDGDNARLRAVTTGSDPTPTPSPTPTPTPTPTPCGNITGDLVITGTSDTVINIACVTGVSGDVIVTDNSVASVIDISSLAQVGGNVNISGNTVAGEIALGALTSVGGTINISENAGSGNIDLGSLGTVSGNVDISSNGDATVNISSLIDVGGDLTLETTGSGNLDLSGGSVSGNIDLGATNYTGVSGISAGGETSISNETGQAVMSVQLPDGAFTTPVSFSITNQDPETLDPEVGTLPGGGQGTIDPVAAYQFNFGVPTLNQDASLVFEVLLAGLDQTTQDVLLSAVASGKATLATKGDEPGSTYQAFSICSVGQDPVAGGCVRLELLDADRQPTTETPAILRFSNVVGHFSTWAVAVIQSPTAASVSISGRVRDRYGRGIRGAIISSIAAADGSIVSVMTNTFGFYRISGLRAGEMYIVSARARRYLFENPTRVISPFDDITGEDFNVVTTRGFPVSWSSIGCQHGC